jgi:hypothetical protein
MEISGSLSAGQTVLSSASVTNAMDAAGAKFEINDAGNIRKLNNVPVSFPISASQANYALANDGSGTLSFSNLSVANLNDVDVSGATSNSMLRYDSLSSKFVMSDAILAGGMGAPTNSLLLNGLESSFATSSTLENYPYMVSGENIAQGISGYYSVGHATGARFEVTSSTSISSIDLWLHTLDQGPGQFRIAIFNFNPVNRTVGSEIATTAVFGQSTIYLPWPQYTYDIKGNSSTPWPVINFSFTTQPVLSPGYYVFGIIIVTQPNAPIALAGISTGSLIGETWESGLDASSNGLGSGYVAARINQSVADTSTVNVLMRTNVAGKIDSSFLRNVNLGGNILSGVASPSVSSDLANKAYVDSVSLQALYTQDVDGLGAIITTDASDGDLIIAGSEKLHITSDSGLDLSEILSVSGSMVAGSLVAGNGSMSVSASGDLGKIQGISYSFPASQAPGSNYALVNDGSGNLSWGQLKFLK